MSLIDAGAAIAAVEWGITRATLINIETGEKTRLFVEINEELEKAVERIKKLPTVEPKVSEWLEDSDPGQEYGTTWTCRKCMHGIHRPYVWNPYDIGYKYCFNCGAKMEMSENND